MSYKIWVLVSGESVHATNSMLYETEFEAALAGNDLLGRWMAAISFEVRKATEEEEKTGIYDKRRITC